VTEAEQETKSSEALLVAWIAHEQAGMVVYLYDPRGPHLHARAVAVSESPAAASEELALIVSSAILARLEGEDFAMDEVALPKPAVPVPPPPRPAPPRPLPIPQEPREPWGAAGLGAVGTKPLSHANWQIGLDLRAWGRVRPLRFGLGYSLYRGLTVSSELAKIIVYRHPIDAWIGLEVWTGKINVLTEAAFTVDPIQRDTLATSAPLASQAPNWRWLWAVSGRVRGEAEVAASLWVTAAVGAEIPLNPFTFEIAIAEQHQPIARILPVRPTADLGLILLWK
jgi:hypothetical protein